MTFVDLSKYRSGFPICRQFRKFGLSGSEVCIATSKLKLRKSAYLDNWLYVRSSLPRDKWNTVKIAIPAPGWWHAMLKDGTAYESGVYASDEEYLYDLSMAARQEILTLYDAGV